MTTYGMEVLTAYDGVIERHVHESGAIISDALQFEALSLDTARYQLNPGTRAFGVRVAFSGSSRVNPYSSTELSLYVEDGAKLRKVLDKLPVVRSGGEWDGNCAGEFYDINSSLAIGKATAHGYAALDMTDKITGSRAMDKGGECISQDSRPTLKKSVLTYNGKQYVVPEQSESR